MINFFSARRWWTAGAALIVAGLLPIVASTRATRTPSPREIRMVVRDMTFYLEGQHEPNPTLRVRAGEQIRMVLRNEDPGMSHDFAVSSWQVMTPLLHTAGSEGVVVFAVPERQGIYPYSCTPHARVMRGEIKVE